MRSRRSNKIRCQSPIVVVVVAAAVAEALVVVVVFYVKVLVLNMQGMRQRNQLLSKDILSNTDLVLELAGIIRHKRKPIETKTCQKDFPLCDQPDQISFTIIWISKKIILDPIRRATLLRQLTLDLPGVHRAPTRLAGCVRARAAKPVQSVLREEGKRK